MKLRNKKTGKIKDYYLIIDDYNSLAELCEEWEDYEEPNGGFYIKANGTIGTCLAIEDDIPDEMLSEMKKIGNNFETKEEAEKAVEKLKAWKRLKDKGFKFKCCDDYHIDYEITGRCAWTDETEKDLDLLFGGEE